MDPSLPARIEVDLVARLDRLQRRERPTEPTIPMVSRLFDRVAAEFFRDLASHRVRSPEHSVTIERLASDIVAEPEDALLVISASGYERHCAGTHGVIYFTVAQVLSCRSVTSGGPTYVLRATHDPYEANYAHGNIETLRDGEQREWPNGVKKKFKADLMRFVLDGHERQIAIFPDRQHVPDS